MGEIVSGAVWWFGLVCLAVFAPIGFFIALSLAVERACRDYPALWRALYDAALTRAKRIRAERERFDA